MRGPDRTSQNRAHDVCYSLELEGFLQGGLRSELPLRLRGAVRRDDDDCPLVAGRATLPEECPAVNVRHVQIKQGHFGVSLFEDMQTHSAAVRFEDVKPISLQEATK